MDARGCVKTRSSFSRWFLSLPCVILTVTPSARWVLTRSKSIIYIRRFAACRHLDLRQPEGESGKESLSDIYLVQRLALPSNKFCILKDLKRSFFTYDCDISDANARTHNTQAKPEMLIVQPSQCHSAATAAVWNLAGSVVEQMKFFCFYLN